MLAKEVIRASLNKEIAKNFISDKVQTIAIAVIDVILNTPIGEICHDKCNQQFLLTEPQIKISNNRLYLQIYFPNVDLFILVGLDGKLKIDIGENDYQEIHLGTLINIYKNNVEFVNNLLNGLNTN